MKAQKYCFYLLTLLIIPIYATARGGKHSGLDALDDWQPITNINDESVQKIGQFAVFEFNRRSNANLLFERVVKGESRFSDGFYYRLVLEAKHGAKTRNYKAIVLDQPWSYVRKLTNFNAV
ncbi:cysteine proteinase inhibitor 1-like [Castanea sativa]|uniref:cysteine proteinase inhibitor 1-like n=1 Tax=Castanea sativa TaxID=21020 RepID=UPI003F6507DC